MRCKYEKEAKEREKKWEENVKINLHYIRLSSLRKSLKIRKTITDNVCWEFWSDNYTNRNVLIYICWWWLLIASIQSIIHSKIDAIYYNNSRVCVINHMRKKKK